jgi:orotate phosphoribosyltransferase
LRSVGALINNVICVILREKAALQNLKKASLEIEPLFMMEELKKVVNE